MGSAASISFSLLHYLCLVFTAMDSELYKAALVKHLGEAGLKPLQRKALENLACGKDLQVVLPTGYGKSIIFSMAPFLLNQNCKFSVSLYFIVGYKQ